MPRIIRPLAWLWLVAALLLAPLHGQKLQVVVEPNRPADEKNERRPADVDQVTKLIIELSNEFRRQEGLRPLAVNRELAKSASDFADFMAGADKYGHTADDRDPGKRAEAAGYDYCLLQENIAYLFSSAGFSSGELAQRLFDGWKNSPEHRQNLLNPLSSEIGVAVAQSAKTARYYGVQEFGRPKSAQIVFEVYNPTAIKRLYQIDGSEFTLEPRYTRRHKRCTPPDLEFAEYETSDGKPIVLHPLTGDRYIVQQTAEGRLRIEKSQLSSDELKAADPKPAEPKPAEPKPVEPKSVEPANPAK